jgi:hypothetical protein
VQELWADFYSVLERNGGKECRGYLSMLRQECRQPSPEFCDTACAAELGGFAGVSPRPRQCDEDLTYS